jgi:hypothetical protein
VNFPVKKITMLTIRRKTLKKIVTGLLSGILFLTACGQPRVEVLPTTFISPSEINTLQSFTSTPLPTRTPRERANEPTRTPRPPTPLPTIPTFTPTFDASTIVTVTPASKAECPKENPEIVAKFATPNSDGSYEPYRAPEVLDYLNAGGTLDRLQNSGLEKTVDLTGDGLHEVLYKEFGYSLFGCKDGYYRTLLYFVGDSGAGLTGILDLNKNGIPEIILYNIVHYGYVDLYVFEWDGNEFRSLINMETDTSTGIVIDWVSATRVSDTARHKLIDTNEDGLKKIVVVYDVNQLCGGFGDFCDGTPRRAQTTTLGWNGHNFVALKQENSSPEYRFQAVQDGDEQTRYGSYAVALSFYQAAIFDDRLKWWSPEQREYEMNAYRSRFEPIPTIYPTPNPDLIEYPRLAAYAYYRIVLLHLVQNHESDATTVYNTLQKKFGNDPYGHPYAEMATVFWEAYQFTHKIYDGCAAAIQYAAEHPEILIPLGSDYHGGYSHTYVPTDVCPFR